MSHREQKPSLLFIHTESGWEQQNEYLIHSLLPYTDGLLTAVPAKNDEITTQTNGGASGGASGSKSQLRYRVDEGLAGILARAHQAQLFDPSRDLLVVSDQIIGPLGSIDGLLDWEGSQDRDGDNRTLLTLTSLDSRDDVTEPHDLAQSETAGMLAMELTCLLVPAGLMQTDEFWAFVREATERNQGAERWLGLAQFTHTLREFGVAVEPVYDAPQDIFARNLEVYLSQQVPFLPWALFTTDPLLLERWAVIPRPAFEYLEDAGYPAPLFWERILRSCPPQTWYTNLSLLDIFPSSRPRGFQNQQRTAVVAHVFYPEMLTEILGYAGNVPDPVELIITTDSVEKKQLLEQMLAEQKRFQTWQVRVVTTNRGRDVSAFLLDCEDVIRNEQIDVILKLHSKKSVQDPASVSGWFRNHLFQNLLQSPGYVDHIMQRFQAEPQLGLVMAPVIHMGVPTMGNGWTLNRKPAEEISGRLGITVPFDSVTPLSPYGSMFYARREALLPLVDAHFAPDEFPDAEGYRDGSVAHVLERLFSYVVFSQGYFARCVQSAALAEVSAVALQYKYDQVSQYLFPFASHQVEMLGAERNGALSGAQIRSLIHRQLSARNPKIGTAAQKVWSGGKAAVQAIRNRIPFIG